VLGVQRVEGRGLLERQQMLSEVRARIVG